MSYILMDRKQCLEIRNLMRTQMGINPGHPNYRIWEEILVNMERELAPRMMYRIKDTDTGEVKEIECLNQLGQDTWNIAFNALRFGYTVDHQLGTITRKQRYQIHKMLIKYGRVDVGPFIMTMETGFRY